MLLVYTKRNRGGELCYYAKKIRGGSSRDSIIISKQEGSNWKKADFDFGQSVHFLRGDPEREKGDYVHKKK